MKYSANPYPNGVISNIFMRKANKSNSIIICVPVIDIKTISKG
jgi:hypothetical protein